LFAAHGSNRYEAAGVLNGTVAECAEVSAASSLVRSVTYIKAADVGGLVGAGGVYGARFMGQDYVPNDAFGARACYIVAWVAISGTHAIQ
jgi:hypothetical protein